MLVTEGRLCLGDVEGSPVAGAEEDASAVGLHLHDVVDAVAGEQSFHLLGFAESSRDVDTGQLLVVEGVRFHTWHGLVRRLYPCPTHPGPAVSQCGGRTGPER